MEYYIHIIISTYRDWEKKRQGQIKSISSYSPRWLSKSAIPRAWITVKLQDEIEMEEYPYKKACNRLFTD